MHKNINYHTLNSNFKRVLNMFSSFKNSTIFVGTAALVLAACGSPHKSSAPTGVSFDVDTSKLTSFSAHCAKLTLKTEGKILEPMVTSNHAADRWFSDPIYLEEGHYEIAINLYKEECTDITQTDVKPFASGRGEVDIEKNKTKPVTIKVYEFKNPEVAIPQSSPGPIIWQLTTTGDTDVNPNESLTLEVKATDPDNLDAMLNYIWASSCGGDFSEAHKAKTVWTAPSTTLTKACILSVSVSQTGKVSESSSVTVQIFNNPTTGAVQINTSYVGYPTLNYFSFRRDNDVCLGLSAIACYSNHPLAIISNLTYVSEMSDYIKAKGFYHSAYIMTTNVDTASISYVCRDVNGPLPEITQPMIKSSKNQTLSVLLSSSVDEFIPSKSEELTLPSHPSICFARVEIADTQGRNATIVSQPFKAGWP